MFRWAWAPLLSGLLLLPVVAAVQGEGSFTFRGPLAFPAASEVEGAPLALFVGQTPEIGAFQAIAPRATVTEFQTTMRGVNAIAASPYLALLTANRSWTVTNARVTFTGGWTEESYLGAYPAEGSRLTLTGEMTGEPRLRSAIGNGASTDGDNPGFATYYREPRDPHFLLSGVGDMEAVGISALKTRGPRVEIRSDQNTTAHETGTSQTGPTERTVTWLYVRFDAPARLTLEEASFEAATAGADAAWDGPLRFTPTQGSLRTSEGAYYPEGGAVNLDGDFRATLSPLADGQARLALSGDLRASSLAFAPAPAPTMGESASWTGLLLLGAAVVVGAAGGVAVWSRLQRRAAPQQAPSSPVLPFTPEDCQRAGSAACSEEDWATAAEWFERGLRLAPTSARLHADYAFCLASLGERERALTHFGRAHELSTDGESAFNAALVAIEEGLLDEAEHYLVAALERSPEFVVHCREDAEFASLWDRPALIQAERRAWEEVQRRGWQSDAEP